MSDGISGGFSKPTVKTQVFFTLVRLFIDPVQNPTLRN